MTKILACLCLAVAMACGSVNVHAASCTSYEAVGFLGRCSGAGALTVLGFYTCDPSIMSATGTHRGAGGTHSFVPIPDPNACSIYPQGQAWGAEAASAETTGDGHTTPANLGNVRASADLATGKLRYFGESVTSRPAERFSGNFLSEARFSDIIYLSVPLSAVAPTVTFSLSVEGSISPAGGDSGPQYQPTQTQTQLSVTTVDSGFYLGGATFAAQAPDIIASNGGTYQAVPTVAINPLNDPYKVLDGDHYLVALKFDALMFGQSDPSWRFDFENSAQLAITISEGITYLASDSGVLLTAVPVAQVITFDALPDRRLGDPPFALAATASSGLPVAFTTLTPSVCALGAPGQATVTLLAAGTCSIAANQAGDAGWLPAAQVTRSFAVRPASGAPQFTSANAATLVVTQPGSFTVSATGNPAPTLSRSGALPGGVTFVAATGLLSGTPAKGTVGSYTVTFTAKNGVAPDATQTFTLTVAKADQTIAFDALPDATFGGPNLVLAAAASSALAVAFASQTPTVCTVSGKTVKLVAAGTCTIAANQAGNANFNPAPTVNRSFEVLFSATTVTTIEASKEPSVTGQAYKVTVTVTSGSGVPKGSVTVDDGHGGACTDLTLSSGIASCTMTSTVAGSLTLTGIYSGSTGHSGSTGSSTHVVNPAATKVGVSSNADPALPGTTVTLSARVTAVSPGKGIPTGLVEFVSGATILGAGTLDAAGYATYTSAAFAVGTTQVVANYLGDANYVAGASAIFKQDIVALPALQFSTSAVTVDESVGAVTLTVVHSGSALGAVSVAYASADGTATAPADYGAVGGTLQWPAGDGANQTIVVPIVADATSEPARKFTVTLGAPSGATLGARSTVTVTIRAN